MHKTHHKPAPVAPPPAAKAAIVTKEPVVVGENKTPDKMSPAEAIRLRAYEKWEVAGKPLGDGVRFWLEAERELLAAK